MHGVKDEHATHMCRKSMSNAFERPNYIVHKLYHTKLSIPAFSLIHKFPDMT
jgi:hypothetical protein